MSCNAQNDSEIEASEIEALLETCNSDDFDINRLIDLIFNAMEPKSISDTYSLPSFYYEIPEELIG